MEQLITAVLKNGQKKTESISISEKLVKNLIDSTLSNFPFECDAFDLIETPKLSRESFTEGIGYLELNYRENFDKRFVQFLWMKLNNENFSELKFIKQLDWILKNKPFKEVRVSDFFTSNYKLFNYKKALQIQQTDWSGDPDGWNYFDRYKVPGYDKPMYKIKDGVDLPLEKWELIK